MWVYIETLPSTSWPIAKNYFETSSMSIIESDPDAGIMLIKFSDLINFKIIIEHGIKEASTEIFLSQYSNDEEVSMDQDVQFIQDELEKIVEFFASSAASFSGTSLAAQNLNDRKKAKIFNINDQTIIELNLGFDRAWSAVTRALKAGNITSNDIDRDNGIFLVSYSVESESSGWFSFLNFNNDEQGNGFKVTVGKQKIYRTNLKPMLEPWSERDVMHIVPVIKGAGRGFGQILALSLIHI